MKVDAFKAAAIATFFLYILLLGTTLGDKAFSYRWWLLCLYFTILILLPASILYLKRKILTSKVKRLIVNLKTPAGKKELLLFLIISVLTLATRFIALKDIPFLTWGDELWEAGLDSLAILSGEIKNFYIIGFPDTYRMPSMGFIQSLISIPFAPFFAHSPLMYRMPAAVIGTANIILVYLVCRKHINRSVAFFASLALIALPIHIYFSRTEIVHITNAFMTTITIYLLFLTHSRFIGNTRWLAVMGLWIGFAATFQTSTRIVALSCLAITILLSIVHAVKQYGQRAFLANSLKYLFIVLFFFFIGFGPKILFVQPDTFLHSQKSVLFQNLDKAELTKLTPQVKTQLRKNIVNVFAERYPTSFLGYIKEPLTNLVEFHYTEEKPLLPPLLAILFIVGLASLLWTTSSLSKWFGFFVLLIPLTHSALTPDLNWSYRLFVASSAAAVIIGIGMWQIVSKITIKLVKYALIAAFSLYLFYVTVRFFMLEPHMANRPVEQYITTHLSYFLQTHQSAFKNKHICLLTSPQQLHWLNWIHAHNQYRYFAHTLTIQVRADDMIPINTVYILENCKPKTSYTSYVIQCSQNLYSICPQTTEFRKLNEPDEINKDFVFYY